MSNKLKITIGIFVFFIALIFFSFNFFIKKHTFESKKSNKYILNYPFKNVKMIMLRTNVLEKIIAAEQGEIVEKKWDNFTLSSARIFRDGIELKGNGNFVISKKDPYMGDMLLDFYQDVDIKKYFIKCFTKLKKSCSYIKDIETNTIIKEDNDQTLFEFDISIKYERNVPVMMIKDIQEKIDNVVEKSLEKNQEIITKILKEYKDKNIIIPLPLSS
jgi:hypothetical protein